jgi:acyl-coenzyme A thioesterase 9
VSQTPKRGRTVGAGIAMRALLRAVAREARERLARPASSARGYAVARERTAITSKLWQDRLAQAKAAGVAEAAATRAQEALVPKPPTRTSIRYSFSADENLLEAYRNPWNAVRVGRVLEDLDSLAGNIAFSHCDDADRATRPQLLVTASVDRVRLMRALKLEEDVILSGAVAWVGRSSMVIRMEAWPADHPDAPPCEEKKTNVLRETNVGKEGYAPGSGPSLSADFTFVARDAVTNKSAAVNPLVPDCDASQTLFAQTAERVARKKEKAKAEKTSKTSFGEDPARPNAPHLETSLASAKAAFVDAALNETRAVTTFPALASTDAILSSATRTENIFVAQPQQRNLSGRIFGGFLLRRAFELAFATSYVFGGARPRFKSVRDMDFLKPVDVGDLLRFKARVLHVDTTSKTSETCVDVEVECLVTKPEETSAELSNTFLFTFHVENEAGGRDGRKVRRVLPASREDAAHVWERCLRPRLDTETDYGR